MKDYDYHSLFYYGILTELQGYRDSTGRKLTAPKRNSKFNFRMAYPMRAQSYPHNYLRDEFINKRDNLIIGLNEDTDQYVILMRVDKADTKAVIYTKALRALFPKDYPVARRELTNLMEKFYELESKPYYETNIVDLSNESHANPMGVDRNIRKNAPSVAISPSDEVDSPLGTSRAVFPGGIRFS